MGFLKFWSPSVYLLSSVFILGSFFQQFKLVCDHCDLSFCTGAVLQNYPTMPGTEARNYPATGSSVMLPLDSANGFTTATILVCGGGNENAFSNPQAQLPASSTCGLLEATATNPQWTMLNMPFQRTMGDMLLLPDGRTLLINGAQSGSAGWGLASNPTLNPVAFNPVDSSFEVQAATTIPRVYHSTAVLLPDTRVLVAGSNTHEFYTFTQPFPTELRVEAFSPQYIDDSFNSQRPTVMVAPAAVSKTKTNHPTNPMISSYELGNERPMLKIKP